MVGIINRIAAAEKLPLEARLADLETSRLEKIHNKGVIVDNRKVLVSSINWNSNSPNFNREAGVIIDHPGVAEYFTSVFEDDWNPGVTTPNPGTDYAKFAAALVVIVALLGYGYYRRRR
ncbi:MAG TPA: phospholipase D-like domain-containing protein [Methanoregula sp.]|nr:phospholipase D-like domain-containing protein [Methanoregula sp.]